tara:strand:- start:262 stop:1086 length:825 start_codon:yes stop_codon:yes gene_type:complete
MASRLERSLQPVVRGAQWYGNRAQGVREGLLQGEGEEGCGYKQDGTYYSAAYGNPKLNVCCGNACAFNLSYIISAPLHYQGYFEFFKSADCFGAIVAISDVLIHLLHWVAALVLDCWIASIADLGHQWMRDLHNGALICLGIALFGLLVAQVFGWLGQPAGKAWPSTVGMIMGGGIASTVFSVMFCLSFSFAVPAVLAATDPEADPPYVSVRYCSLANVAIKIIALATTRANIDFWGSCEQADKLNNICLLMSNKRPSGVPLASNKMLPEEVPA